MVTGLYKEDATFINLMFKKRVTTF